MFEHQAAFMEMLRVGRDMRKRMFDTLEERHAQDFQNGKAGMKLYEELLSAVRDAGVPEAVTEFESRFLPLLNKDRPQADAQSDAAADLDLMAAAEGRWRGGWVFISSLVGAAVIAGALFFGYNILKTTTGRPPAVTETPPPVAGSASQTPAVTEEGAPATSPTETASEPPVATGAPVPATQPTEPESPTTSEPAPAMPAEQEPASGR